MIYVSTDSNEVRAILEDFDSSKDPYVADNKRLVRDYHQTFHDAPPGGRTPCGT